MTELNLKGKLVTDGLQNVQRITKLNLKGHFVTDDQQNITFRCEGTSKYWGLVSMYAIKPNLSISELKSNYLKEF
jgi:hypothetical protein